MADQQVNITLNAIDNTKKALTDLQNNLKGIDKQTKEATSTFFTFSNTLKTLITVEALRKTYNILTAFQDIKIALNQVTGSVEQGARAFNFLNKFSETSRFNIKDLSDAFIGLYRSGINPSEELLKTFTDTASAAKDPLQALNALILLFTKGTEGGLGLLQFRRLEGELIPVFKILREQFGLSKDAVEDYLKTVNGTRYVLGLLREGLAKTFGGTEAANAKNLSRTFDDVKNSAEKLINSLLGENGLNAILVTTFNLMKDLIDLVKNSDLARGIGAILGGISFAFGKASEAIEAYKKARQGFREAIGMGEKTLPKPEEVKQPVPNTLSQDVYQSLINAQQQIYNNWNNINETISKGTVEAIKSVSQGIAESIVLGKKLGDTFREIAQKIVIKIISGLIEEQLIKLALIALDQFAVILGLEKLATERAITEEKRKQAILDGKVVATPEEKVKKQLGNIFDELWKKLSNTFDDIFNSIGDIFKNISDYSSQIFSDIGSSLMDILGNLGSSLGDIFNSIGGSFGDILGSIGNIFGGGGGGGGFDLGTLFDIGEFLFFAEGGNVSAGQPYVVGERGRELFIPSTNGTIIPNQDLGGMGNMNINFTINATDVKGVQELLINNRATITNLINQALNARGKANLV